MTWSDHCAFCRTIAKRTFEKEGSREGRKEPLYFCPIFCGDISWYQDTWADRPTWAAPDSSQKILTRQKGQLAMEAVRLPHIVSPWDICLVGLLGFHTL